MYHTCKQYFLLNSYSSFQGCRLFLKMIQTSNSMQINHVHNTFVLIRSLSLQQFLKAPYTNKSISFKKKKSYALNDARALSSISFLIFGQFGCASRTCQKTKQKNEPPQQRVLRLKEHSGGYCLIAELTHSRTLNTMLSSLQECRNICNQRLQSWSRSTSDIASLSYHTVTLLAKMQGSRAKASRWFEMCTFRTAASKDIPKVSSVLSLQQ